MQIEVLRQPEVGHPNARDFIVRELDDDRAIGFRAQTGWVQPSGLALIADAIRGLQRRGGSATLLCGLSQGAATVDGLASALDLFDEVFVSFDPSGRTVHSKAYAILQPADAAVLVGSQNLTRGGLVTNHELALVMRGPIRSPQIGSVLAHMDDMIGDAPITRRLTSDVLDLLQRSGQVRFAPPGVTRSDTRTEFVVFEPSGRKFRSDAVSTPRTRAQPAAEIEETPIERSAVIVKRWFKRAPRSDVLRPRSGSSPTNTITLVRNRFPIDSATWFRHEMFPDALWNPVAGSPGHERAVVPFLVEGLSPEPVLTSLTVENNRRHAAGQANRVTSIRWSGEVQRILRSEIDATGMVFTVERFDDQSHRLTFSAEPIGDFVDD